MMFLCEIYENMTKKIQEKPNQAFEQQENRKVKEEKRTNTRPAPTFRQIPNKYVVRQV